MPAHNNGRSATLVFVGADNLLCTARCSSQFFFQESNSSVASGKIIHILPNARWALHYNRFVCFLLLLFESSNACLKRDRTAPIEWVSMSQKPLSPYIHSQSGRFTTFGFSGLRADESTGTDSGVTASHPLDLLAAVHSALFLSTFASRSSH